jgi:uncharacterized protein (TIGR02271 family)
MSDQEITDSPVTIPLVAERLRIDKRDVVTGGVRVQKQVVEHTETIRETLSSDELDIARVPVGRFVDAAPQLRQEGDVTIIPVVEEVAVVQTRLWLREEVHVTRRRVAIESPQTVTLRREELHIESLSADTAQQAVDDAERHE